MQCLLLNVLLLCFLLYEVGCSMDEEWNEFKIQYNKTYKSKREDRFRRKIFNKNMKAIRKHNRRFKKNAEQFEKGMNVFGDLTASEFSKKYGLFVPKYGMKVYGKRDSHGRNNQTQEAIDGVPDQLDWRERGAVTAVKDQGSCGSCWIFSAVQVLESYHFLKTGELVSLSEQNIVDCFSNDTCEGGNPENAFEFARSNGIHRESDYPYRQKWEQCHASSEQALNITYDKLEYIRSEEAEEQMKVALAKHGPLSICMFVTAKWQFYKSGVWYDRKCSEITNHSMLLVGYGTEDGRDYWLIKNSWGPHWGMDGYIKVIRNRYRNYCGITSESAFVI